MSVIMPTGKSNSGRFSLEGFSNAIESIFSGGSDLPEKQVIGGVITTRQLRHPGAAKVFVTITTRND